MREGYSARPARGSGEALQAPPAEFYHAQKHYIKLRAKTELYIFFS